MSELINQLNAFVAVFSLILALHLLRPSGPYILARRLLAATLMALGFHALLLFGIHTVGRPSLAADLQPGAALAVFAFATLFFSSLKSGQVKGWVWHIVIPSAVTAAMLSNSLLWSVDILVLGALLVYALIFVRLYLRGAQNFEQIPHHQTLAWMWAGAMALYSLLIFISDALIYWDVLSGASANHSWFLMLSAALKLTVIFCLLWLKLEDSPVTAWLFELTKPKRPHSEKDTKAQKALFEALSYFLDDDKNLAREDLSLRAAANALGVPIRALSQAVNNETGESFSRLINRRRVAFAKRLMQEHPNLPITTIFYDAGFQTKSSFNREFKSVTNQTPSEYKRSLLA